MTTSEEKRTHVKPWLGTLKIVLIYLLVGGAWIVLSDRILEHLVYNPERLTQIQTYKGWFYVLATSVMLYHLIRKHTAAIGLSDEALMESEGRFRALVDASPDAIFVSGLDGSVRLASRQSVELLKAGSSQELVGRNLMDFIAPEDRERLREAREKNQSGSIEYTLIRIDGSLVPVETNFTKLFNRAGTPAAIMSIVRDITERKEAEKKRLELEKNQREFYRRTIIAATQGKLVITDKSEIERIAGPATESWKIEHGDDLSRVREAAARIAEDAGMSDMRLYDFVLAIGEATTNAYKHGGGGSASIHRRDDTLMFVVSDNGPGIEALVLPEVALVKGYSTAGTLGMGYKAILAITDQVYLATGPGGTTVGMEMSVQPASKPIDTTTIPDTWF